MRLELEQVSFSYKKPGEQVLKNLTLSISGSESVGLVGANGAGKSTLLKLLVGLVEGYDGRISIVQEEGHAPGYDGNISPEYGTFLTLDQSARLRIGYVFQDSESQLFMATVGEDVAFGPRNEGVPEEEVEKRVENALKAVHIEHLRDSSVYRISGGEKKLASIATILSMRPQVILLDEPSVALDPKNRRNLIRVLNEIPVPKLIASHDLDFIWDTCERTILLSHGEIVRDGATEEIMRDEACLVGHGLELPLSLSRI